MKPVVYKCIDNDNTDIEEFLNLIKFNSWETIDIWKN